MPVDPVTPRERVSLTYQAHAGDGSTTEKELPLKLLVIGDFAGRAQALALESRPATEITAETFDDVLAAHAVMVSASVTDLLSREGGELAIALPISRLADFTPDALLVAIPALRDAVALRDGLLAVRRTLTGGLDFATTLARALADESARADMRRELGLEAPPVATTGARPATEPLLDRLLLAGGLDPGDGSYVSARRALGALLRDALTGAVRPTWERSTLDERIADFDRRLAAQLDALLHHDAFQRVEAAWRGLRLLVDRVDQRENVKVVMVAVSQDELREDFEDAPEITQSGLFKLAYASEYGQYGGEPYAAIIGDYAFTAAARDIALLHKVAAVATMAHAPFIAAASPRLLGLESFDRLDALSDVHAHFEGPQFVKWRALRSADDARSVGLALPRVLLRLPYGDGGPTARAFAYREEVAGRHESHLWGNAAFAFACRLVEAFARWRWCPDIIGDRDGGVVRGLPLRRFAALGAASPAIPTEALLGERLESELADQGLIPLAARPAHGDAAFYTANSCHRPRTFARDDAGRAAELDHRLGAQLPYLFIVTRLAHYLKVIQRERIGAWTDRGELERQLNDWLGRYVVDMDSPAPELAARRPLRGALAVVEETPGDAGWYRISLSVRPHLKHLGASFSLSLVGRLDRVPA